MSGTKILKDDAINYDEYANLFIKSSINHNEVKKETSLNLLQDYKTFKNKLMNQRSLHK
jgi:hypothetical protein